MDWPRVDTRWWNLSFGVAATTAMAACGPTITLDDGGETITDSDGETDSETTPTTEPPPVECTNNSDCEPGWECIDNVCVYYDYCADGGCCDYGDCCYYDDCCYGECYYYECYSDGDCGVGGLCELGQECTHLDLIEECLEPVDMLPLPLAEGGADEVVSLSFVDADGDGAQELVVARESGEATLFRNGPEGLELTALPFPADAPLAAVVAADLTGDGAVDLVGADAAGRITILSNGGAGEYVLAAETSAVPPIVQMSALDWNGDALPDLAVLAGDARVHVFLGDGASSYQQIFSLDGPQSAYDLVPGDFGADAFDDLAVQTDHSGDVFWGNAVGDTVSDDELDVTFDGHGPRGLVGGNLDGTGAHELVGHTAIESWDGGWAIIEGWRDGSDPLPPMGLAAPVALAAQGGDVSGDGLPDVVTLGESTLSILRSNPEGGGAPLFSCASYVGLGTPTHLMAVGDFDGSGRADIALADVAGVTLLMAP